MSDNWLDEAIKQVREDKESWPEWMKTASEPNESDLQYKKDKDEAERNFEEWFYEKYKIYK